MLRVGLKPDPQINANIGPIYLDAYLLLTFYIMPAVGSDKYQFEYFESQLGYFKQLTLGQYANNNDKRIIKWVNDINIFVKGDMPTVLSDEIDSIIAELNHIVSGIQLTRVTSEEQANYLVITGSTETNYLNFHPNVPLDSRERFGNFLMYPNSDPEKSVAGFLVYPNADHEIIYGSMYIDFDLDKYRRHILRQLLTQSLGIPYKSRKYGDSIFFYHPSMDMVTRYSHLDKTIIDKLYDKCVKAGMDKFEVDHALVNGC